jgi:hypothetical protein
MQGGQGGKAGREAIPAERRMSRGARAGARKRRAETNGWPTAVPLVAR